MDKTFFALILSFAITLANNQYAYAQDGFPEFNFTGYADARVSYSSGEPSWFQRGVGKTRYGSDAAGNDEIRANLAEAALLIDTKYTWELSSFVNIKFDPEQTAPIDIVEAFFKYNKLMNAGYRIEARVGAFYPHISLENYGIAWTSPYSITSSAINSWVGEEVKTTGLEISVEKEFDDFAVSLTSSIFGGNDTSGTLLFFRGWALHDSKTALFSDFPLPTTNALSPEGMFWRQDPYTSPHYEIDNRPGYFVGGSFEYYGLFTLSTLYYDNRALPETLVGGQYGWESDFLNVGLTIDLFQDTEIFGQYMYGNTKMGPDLGFRPADANYESFYVMLSHKIGRHRFSARYDDFSVIDLTLVEMNNNNENGHAWMMAYAVDTFENQHLIVELLQVASDRPERTDFGLPAKTNETQLQASYRVIF